MVLKDLLKYLKNGKILGAALDVLEFESSSFSSVFYDLYKRFLFSFFFVVLLRTLFSLYSRLI